MDEQSVTIEFTYSLQDLREGYLRKLSTGKLIYGILGIASWIFILLVLLGWLLFTQVVAKGAPLSYPKEIDDLWLTLLPSLMPAFFIFSATVGSLIAGGTFVGLDGGTEQNRRFKIVSQITGLIGGLFIYLVGRALFDPSMAIPWAPTRAKIVVVSFVPWILLILWVIA